MRDGPLIQSFAAFQIYQGHTTRVALDPVTAAGLGLGGLLDESCVSRWVLAAKSGVDT
jgi:hypothetical protein